MKPLAPFVLFAVCSLAHAPQSIAQTILIDFGNDSTFRGVTTPGNWNSVAFGFVANLLDSNGSTTTLDWAPDGLGGTDSFNSIAGPTSNPVTGSEIATADAAINKTTLGLLGQPQAAIDFFKSDNGVTSVGRFQIQQVTAGQLYDLTFYGTRQFVDANNTQTRYSVFSDSAYSTLLGNGTLTTGTTNGTGNPGNTVTISNLAGPSNANNIFYVQWEGVNTSAEGYINSMSITVVPEPSSIALFAVGGLVFVSALVRRRARAPFCPRRSGL